MKGIRKQQGKSVNSRVKISDQSINTNKDNRSTQVTTRRNRILSSQKMVGKEMVKRQSKGTSRKLCMGVTMDKEFLDGYLDKHAAELKISRSWLAYSILRLYYGLPVEQKMKKPFWSSKK
ncbi:MAG TPA: hypothetical protein VLA74_06125 [Nitrososphaeraceae archaeon]|nr:hypothetical protein [Nitrososphaeraceae archaeon]